MKKLTLIFIACIALTSCEDISKYIPKERPFDARTNNTKRFNFESGSMIQKHGTTWELAKGKDGHDYLTSTTSVAHYIDCKLCISRTNPNKKINVTNYVTLIPDTFNDSRILWQMKWNKENYR